MTTRWPWTSRARLDDALAEVAHLRVEVAKLTDALTRICRREVGLPEVPRQLRPPLEPMPQELHEHYKRYGDQRLAKAERDVAYRAHAQGKPWAQIVAEVTAQKEDEVP